MRLTAMPSLKGRCICPSREQQKHGRVRGVCEYVETAETSGFLHQTGAVEKGLAHFLFQAVRNPKPGHYGDHTAPLTC